MDAPKRKPGPKINPDSAYRIGLAKRKTTPGSGKRSNIMVVEGKPNFMAKFSPWSEDVGAEIVHRVAMGESIAAICRQEGMPGQRTVHHWLVQNGPFRQALMGARGSFADRIVEESLDIADDVASGASHEAVGHARLRIQARQWLASKYRPAAYGEKFDVSGEVAITTVVLRKFAPVTTIDVECAQEQPRVPTLPT